MSGIKRFILYYRTKLIRIVLEEYLGWMVRGLPGFFGMVCRHVVNKVLFKELAGFSKIYPGVYLTHTYGISAGKGFSVNSGTLIDGRGGIIIGDGVLIGPNTSIVSSRHEFDRVEVPIAERNHLLEPVTIGDDVWIGANVVIAGGVAIGKGVVVMAGAVVVKDVDDHMVVGGVPAKVVKDRREMKE